jgi:hypothetical protein
VDSKGGLEAQVREYMADFWQVFGINALDIWELPANEFFPMSWQVDAIRREAKKPSK